MTGRNRTSATNLYEAARGADRVARENKGAPLARGVQGRTQAVMNMSPRNQEVANLKTKARAAGKPVPRRA
jgi:hypothetical protein